MSPAPLSCPGCSRNLPVARPAVSKRLRCPWCGHSFTFQAEGAAAPEKSDLPGWLSSPDEKPALPPAPVAALAPPPPAPPAVTAVAVPAVSVIPTAVAVSEDQAGSPRPRRLVVAASVLGGLLLLGGAAIGTVFHLGGKDSSSGETPAAADGSTAAPAGSSDRGATGGETQLARHYDRPLEPAAPIVRPRLDAPPSPPLEPGTGAGPRSALDPEMERKVREAIDAGIRYLRQGQGGNGAWGGGSPVGLTALAGLTLLECGVAAADPQIQNAAAFVRASVGTRIRRTETYEISLAILFLDRLGDPRDDGLIRSLGLRLIAAQTPAGGWWYPAPALPEGPERMLLTALEQSRPHTLRDLATVGVDGKLKGLTALMADDNIPDSKLKPLGVPAMTRPASPDEPQGLAALEKLHRSLPPGLQQVPALKHRSQTGTFPVIDRSDNSNTQFGILGLWAARKHGLPAERAMALLVTRFRSSQGADGGWSYPYRAGGAGRSMPAMTCAGLLGLAVGHGLASDADAAERRQDPEVDRAFKYLADHIDTPTAHGGGFNMRRGGINLYYLWSVERVAVLFNLTRIGGKSWYPWGARLLVGAQKADGSWLEHNYHGSSPLTDTCFALLFLRRANLAHDLSRKLELVIEVKDLK